MSQKSRVEQQDELFTEFCFLVDPIRRLVFDDDDPKGKVPYVRAQFVKEAGSFSKRAKDICQDGDYFYQVEWRDLIHAIDYFPHIFDELQDLEHQPRGRESVREDFLYYVRIAQQKLRAIPTNDPSTILPAESPFQTYLRLRAMCCKASQRLQIFDPYLGVEPFHIYLAEVRDSVEVTIVTSSAIMDAASKWQARDYQRRDRIVTISELFSIEHPTSYQFRVTQQQHDRHMRIDNDIFHRGNFRRCVNASHAAYPLG